MPSTQHASRAGQVDSEGAAVRSSGREVLRHATYRSLFTFAQDPDAGAAIESQLAAWLRQKKYDVDLASPFTALDGGAEVATVRNSNAEGRQFRFLMKETTQGAGVWHSEVTAHLPQRGRGWVHVAVRNDAGRTPATPGIAGRLLDVLPDPRDGAMRLAAVPPVLRPEDLEATVDAICDPDRHGLLLLAGSARDDLFDRWVTQVRKWARPTAGVAQVAVCDPDLTALLTDRLGHHHAVAPWTIRTFRPDADPGYAADGRRHRVLGSSRLGTDSDHALQGLLSRITRYHANSQPYEAAVTRVFRDLDRIGDKQLLERLFPAPSPKPGPAANSPAQTPTRPAPQPEKERPAPPPTASTPKPAAAEVPAPERAVPAGGHDELGDDRPGDLVAIDAGFLDSLLEQAAAAERRVAMLAGVLGDDFDEDALLALLDAATAPPQLQGAHDHLQANQELVVELQEDLEDKERSLVGLGEDLLVSEWERTRVADENLWLRGKLRDLEAYEAASARLPEDQVTEFPSDFDELVDWLPQLQERGVVFTGDATVVRKLVDIDATGKFALSAWETLLVLADYVAARRCGAHETNVELYLKGTPSGFRAMSPKRHAPGETSRTLEQFGHLRDFPVPAVVEESGVVRMGAHFKLAQHGMVSPRLHYYDDVARTGKVYVGYIGEHLRCVTTN